MKNTINKPINIGLPKGFLKSKSLKLTENLLNKKIDRNLLKFINDEFNIYLLKSRDIPTLIEKGNLDIGIALTEWVEESGCKVSIIKELNWYAGRISLIAKAGFIKKLDQKINCVTEFPKITENFFKKKRIKNYAIQKIYGSSEGLVPEIYNCCIDCVETGETLKKHKLNEEYVIMKTKAILVQKKSSENKELKKTIKLLDKLT